MVTRITSQMQQANSLQNIFRITEDLFKVQQEIASGKRISLPSDDPAGIRDALLLSTSIGQAEQYVRNIDSNEIVIQASDTSLQSIDLGLVRAKELAISELGGASTAETRSFAAAELDQIISQVFESANAKIQNQYIFSGTESRVEPFGDEASGAVYLGSSESFQIGIASNINLDLGIPGSEVLGTDLNPVLSDSTLLSSLNGGAGVTPGTILITDRAGNAASITVSPADTIGNLISRVNAAGVNVTASINSSGNGLQFEDNSSVISQSLTVSEVSGSTAAELGVLGKGDGILSGSDLNSVVTSSTLVSNLLGGEGLVLNEINIVNGAASGTVTLSSTNTIGDVLSLINDAGINVTASINSSGNALHVTSNDPSTVAVVRNVGTDGTAESLGLGGGKNIFSTLYDLRSAFEKDDTSAILASLENLDTGLASINNSRAILGASLSRLDNSSFVLEQSIVDQAQQLANIEDADLVKSASDLANLEFALQATLSSTAQILQPTLLDFLR